MTDLRKNLQIGSLVMRKYRWSGEPKRDYVYKIKGFRYDGTLADVTMIGVFTDGEWSLINREAALWDFEFKIGAKTPKQGWGKAFKFSRRK